MTATDCLLDTIWLPIELTNGNDGRKKSWYKPAKIRKDCETLIRAHYGKREPYEMPVRVQVIRILGKRQQLWDSSSILRGNYKEIEDALVACGWFADDSPKWITQTVGLQDATRRDEGPATEIHIFAA